MRHFVQLIESFELMEGEMLPKLENLKEPLRDDQSIRVFHGVNYPEEIYQILRHGLSGQMKAKRLYSYEANNNPYGLFVTPDFDTAKKFGAYILELNVRIRDLEAPVWPNGTFATQGQYAPSFKDNDHREEAKMTARSEAEKMEDVIAQSDRPEVAASLLAIGERQALFTGMLDPNSTKAIWMSNNPQRTGSTYSRMSRGDFIKKFERGEAVNPFSGGKSRPEDIKDDRQLDMKLLRPREKGDIDTFMRRFIADGPPIKPEKALEIIKKDPTLLKDYVWSDQQYQELLASLEEKHS